ncbi:MAG: hypothetical protein MH252_17560 [Thermosynechococcaceae cyanobacterium MS004]|nr:hypothetical protein [Thermosynechococcaceae cyanobacterium MS004]
MKKSNTTRYLCAAAQIDRTFRSQVLEKILDEEYRVISIPAGVDLLAVAKHCLDAKRRKLIRNIVLSILFIIALVSAYGQVSYGLEYGYTDPISAFLRSIFSSFFSFYFLLSWAVVVFETWITRYQIIAKSLLKQNFNPDGVTLTDEAEAEIRRKLSGVINEEDCNIVIYSGFTPFVGSGTDIGGWSFTLNINKGKEEMKVAKKPEPFTVEELYSYIDSDIRKLHLQGTSIQDKIFVNGQEIRGDERFLPDLFHRPLTQVDQSTLKEFIGGQSDGIRHYKCIRIIGWQGEIILSVFLRFLKLRQNLFVEASYFFLPPLKQEYRKIDEIQHNPTWRQLVQMLQETFMKALFLFPFSIFLLSGELFRPLARWNQRISNRRLIRENPMFDYGASTSIRELAASNLYSHYFQKLDKEMYLKLIERQILDSIVNFLDAHNIDTSDLRARQDTILNNGVIVTGGSVEVQNLTVGERAKSVMNNVTQAVSSVTSTQASSSKN